MVRALDARGMEPSLGLPMAPGQFLLKDTVLLAAALGTFGKSLLVMQPPGGR